MWSHDARGSGRRGARIAGALLMAAFLAGCFQPMYGDRSVTGSASPLRSALASVDVGQIPGQPGTAEARMAVELRNELTYALTGGGDTLPPTHRLNITIRTGTRQLIVDPTTARGEFEVVSLDANYTLVDIASKKTVVSGSATASTSFDIPGQQQRYGAIRGQRDSQSRAARVIAEQIRNRLASYFSAGS